MKMVGGLWLALGVLLVVAIALFVILGGSYRKDVNEDISFENVSCIGPLNNFPNIDEFPERFATCNTYEGVVNPQRYYDVENDWTIAPLPRSEIPSAQAICSGICPQTQLPVECVEQNENYASCLQQLLPQNCSDPANPVAVKGNAFYYVVGKSKIECF